MYGDKIASIRMARGYTQKLMADKLGMEQTDYSKIERNERKRIDEALLKKIADSLGVSVEDIKSPTPIVMSFHNSNYNAPYGTQNNLINEEIVKELSRQLKVKDEQIGHLMALLNK